ncbi:MAG: hypothetical protein PUP91_37920 [Rhizonema sp. PD37]|nr:hypothetical protein [Rhizonema sp. PD37]
MTLIEKIEKILETPSDLPKAGKRKGENYNPFGRSEKLIKKLSIRVSLSFKTQLMQLPNWAEIVRTILEDDLDSGEFFLRHPQPKKRGRGGDLIGRSGADDQIVVKVGEEFLERITSILRWQAKAREALYQNLPIK